MKNRRLVIGLATTLVVTGISWLVLQSYAGMDEEVPMAVLPATIVDARTQVEPLPFASAVLPNEQERGLLPSMPVLISPDSPIVPAEVRKGPVYASELHWKYKGPERLKTPWKVFEDRYGGLDYEGICKALADRAPKHMRLMQDLAAEHYAAGEYEEIYAAIDPSVPQDQTGFILDGGAKDPTGQVRTVLDRPGYFQVVWIPADLHYDYYELADEVAWLTWKKLKLEGNL